MAADPGNPIARSFLAQVRFAEGDLEQAELELSKLVEGEKSYLPAYLALAGLRRSSNRCGEAVELYQRAIELAPDLAAAYQGLGDCFINLGKMERGEGAYERALARSPQVINAVGSFLRLP